MTAATTIIIPDQHDLNLQLKVSLDGNLIRLETQRHGRNGEWHTTAAFSLPPQGLITLGRLEEAALFERRRQNCLKLLRLAAGVRAAAGNGKTGKIINVTA